MHIHSTSKTFLPFCGLLHEFIQKYPLPGVPELTFCYNPFFRKADGSSRWNWMISRQWSETLERFQFRWLKIKYIYAAISISMTLFLNHLKKHPLAYAQFEPLGPNVKNIMNEGSKNRFKMPLNFLKKILAAKLFKSHCHSRGRMVSMTFLLFNQIRVPLTPGQPGNPKTSRKFWIL